LVSEQQLHLDSPALDRWRQVLDRHRGQWRLAGGGPGLRAGAGRIAHLQPGDVRDPDQAALNAISPLLGIHALAEPNQRGLVDQPVGQSQAPAITSGSTRSTKVPPNLCKSSTVT